MRPIAILVGQAIVLAFVVWFLLTLILTVFAQVAYGEVTQ
jgi:hypothetical protein